MQELDRKMEQISLPQGCLPLMCQRCPPPGMLLHQNSRSTQLLVNRGLIEEMPLSYLLSSCGNLEVEPSRAKGGIVSRASQNQHKTIKIKIGSDGESKALTGRCQDDTLSSATAIQGRPSASFHYHHQTGRHQWGMEAYNTMLCSFSARSGFIRKPKDYT